MKLPKTIKIIFGLILLLSCNISIAQNNTDTHKVQVGSVKVGDIVRSYSFYIPKGVKEKPKLVLVLHGSTMTPKSMLSATGFEFNKQANISKNAIIVYPQGYEKYWNDCRKSATYKANTLNIDDSAFFKAIIAKFAKDYKTDINKSFVAGYSNGGHMVYKLAEENPDLFNGFAVISASLPVESNNDCVPKNKPVSILIANGTTDPIDPFNGGEVTVGDGKKRGKVIPTYSSVQYWKDLMGCGEIIETRKELPDTNKEDNSTVEAYDYKCSTSNKKVKLLKIINGGHVVPNDSFIFYSKKLGNVNKDINLPGLILDFFDSIK